MKILKIFLVIISLGLAVSTTAQDYDLNLKTVKNDAVAGGELHVVVQIRATSAKSTFNLSDFTLRVAFSNAALSVGTVTPLPAARYEWQGQFSTHMPIKSVSLNSTIIGLNELVFFQADPFTANIPNTPLTIGTAWVDVISFKFDIISADAAYLFLNLGQGLGTLSGFNLSEVTSSVPPQTTAPLGFGEGFTRVTYDGTNWKGGNGTNNAPNSTDGCKEIYIAAGTATITGNVACDFFRVDPGAKLIVASQATLRTFMQNTVNGQFPAQPTLGFQVSSSDDFVIDANSTGYGQYIGPGLPGTIKQWVGTDQGWRNMSFPVANTSSIDLAGGLFNFDVNSTSYNGTPDDCGSWGNEINSVNVYTFGIGGQPHEWYGAASNTPTGSGVGYNVFVGGPIFGSSGVITAKGTFYDQSTVGFVSYTHDAPHRVGGTGSQSSVASTCITDPPADRQSNWNGWVLLGNPFPSNLDVEEFAKDNGIALGQIRIWDRVGNTIVAATDATKGFTTIAPMQGFWVKTGSAGDSKNLIFHTDQRVFGTTSFLKFAGNQVVLTASNTSNNETKSIYLQFNAYATKGYDQLFDSYGFNSQSQTAPQLAFDNSHMYDGANILAPLDYNAVPDVQASDSYNLRFWSRTAGQFKFDVDSATMLPGWHVFIEDTKLSPGVYQDITSSPYTFSYDPATDAPNRFIMHFSTSAKLTVDEDDAAFENTSYNALVYTDEYGIHINFEDYPFEKVSVQIHNSAGQLLNADTDVNTNELYSYRTDNNSSNFYLITVINSDGSTFSSKIIN